MDEREFLQQVFFGKTPNIDEFVDVLGDRFPLLKDYQSTPQDREWHAEGDVHIHVGMVLAEAYKLLQGGRESFGSRASFELNLRRFATRYI